MARDFESTLMSRHAWREARRERIPLEMIQQTYDDPDRSEPSADDDLRELRSRWFGDHGLVVVVDIDDGRVVTVFRKGWKP